MPDWGLVILAASNPDGWFIAQWIVNVVGTIALAYIAVKNQKIDQLSGDLKTAMDKRIDEKFNDVRSDIERSVESFKETVSDFKERFKEGDEEFREMLNSDHKIELSVVQRIAQERQWMMENLATKSDVKSHEQSVNAHLNRQDGSITKMQQELAVLTARKKD